MEGRLPASSRVISPVQFSAIGMANGLDFGSTNLFPSLPPVEDNAIAGMDTLSSQSNASVESSKTGDSITQDSETVKVLIDGVKVILQEQHCPVHIKDIITKVQEEGYADSSKKLLESLESILRNEASKSSSEIVECQLHWFTLKDAGNKINGKEGETTSAQLPGHRRTIAREANLIKYKKKYRRLKKLIKRLIFENAAIADEIVRADARFQRAKVERKFLLKQLMEYQSICHESVQPVKVSLPPPEVLVHPPGSPTSVIEPPAKPKSVKVRAKKTATGKTKKEVESSAPAKAPPEEKKVSEVSSASQENKSEPPPKPKRKKPGTAIKRRVQPIPVDSKGKPMFPIVLGGLTVHSLGDIVWDRPGFHSERYIWPVGFCSSRLYPSMKTPDKKCIYTCKILDGGYGPTFVMSPEDDSENSIEASSATACHCVVLKAINKARGKDATNTGSGPEFFGFSHPTIQYLLQSLPNARKCSKYQWVKFELPKGKNAGKLGSSVVPTDEAMDVNDHHDRPSTSFDAEEILKDDSMDGSSSEAMRTLTLTSAASNISQLPSPGFESSMLSYQLKSTSGDPSLDLGTPISPPQSSLSSPLQLSPKINTNAMSPSVTSQPSFVIPPSSPLFGFDDAGLPD